MSQYDYFYHATTVENLELIKKSGKVNPNSYFGIEEISEYYAETIEDDGLTSVVLKIPASCFDTKSIEVDWPGISEPVTYSTLGIKEDDVHDMWEASNKSPQACLEIIGSFRYAQSIPFSDSFITE